MRSFGVLIAALLMFTAPARANGILSLSLSPSVLYGAPGDTIEFSGTLQNTGDATLFVNDLHIFFGSFESQFTWNFLFSNVPGTFEPTDPAWTGIIADITIDPSISLGSYAGVVTVIGGAGPSNFDPQTDGIATGNFSVVATPEPSAIALAVLGILTIVLWKAGRARPTPARVPIAAKAESRK